MKTFKLTTQGRQYEIAVRGAYRDTITSEKKLIATLMNSSQKANGEKLSQTLVKKMQDDKVFDVAEFFGIIAYRKFIKKV